MSVAIKSASGRTQRSAVSAESTKPPRFTDAELSEAAQQVPLAFQIAGLLGAAGNPTCPACGNADPKKVVWKVAAASSGSYWKCYPCGAYGGAVKLLTERGVPFVQAVNQLLGRDTEQTGRSAMPAPQPIPPSFAAVVDVEVYDAILESADVAAAQRYWAEWHIDPEVVRLSRSGVVNARSLQADLLARFGMARLLQCGVCKPGEEGRPEYWLLNEEYPVLEPHLSPTGHAVGLQFRPAGRRKAAVEAHKAFKRRWAAVDGTRSASTVWAEAAAVDPKAAGPKVPYVPPFLSLRGAGQNSYVGCGLPQLATSPPTKVYVVEGFKDLLAANTLGGQVGWLAYAVPGVGTMPPPLALAQLKRHTVCVALDGDAAGARGRETMVQYLTDQGITATAKPVLVNGLDVADVLVDKHAKQGCTCRTCRAWRKEHPAPH